MYSSCNLSAPSLSFSSPISREFSSLASVSRRCNTKKPSGIVINSKNLRANSRATSSSSTIAHGNAYRSSVSAVLTDDNSAAVKMEEDVENIGLLSLDPALEAYKDHFKYRITRFADQKKLIKKHEGSLEEFAQGYLQFGFNRQEDCIVYREWAPAALW